MPSVFVVDGSQRGRGRGGMGRGRGAMPKNKKQKGKNWGRGKGRGADPPTEGPKSARHPSAGSEVFTTPFRISITNTIKPAFQLIMDPYREPSIHSHLHPTKKLHL